MRGSNMRDRFCFIALSQICTSVRDWRGGKLIFVSAVLGCVQAVYAPRPAQAAQSAQSAQIAQKVQASLASQGLNFEDQKAIMDAQIELLHKEAELHNALRQVHQAPSLSLPQIVSIAGVSGRFIARLDLGQGVQDNFLSGEQVEGDLSVQSISQERVSVLWTQGKKSQVLNLKFLNAAQERSNAISGANTFMGTASNATNPTPLPLELLGSLPRVSFPQPYVPISKATLNSGQEVGGPKGSEIKPTVNQPNSNQSSVNLSSANTAPLTRKSIDSTNPIKPVLALQPRSLSSPTPSGSKD